MPRPQFTLRALLVTTTVLAGPCAWVAHNANIVRQRKAVDPSSWSLRFMADERPERSLPWLRRVLGDEAIARIYYSANRDPDGSELRRARALFPEAAIQPMPPLKPILVRIGPPPR